MRKVILVFMALVLVSLTIGMVYGEQAIDTEMIDGAYDGDVWDGLEVVKEWIFSVGDTENAENAVFNGIYKGYGVLDAKTFESEYGCIPSADSMKEILNSVYETDYVEIVVAGFIDNVTVYKIVAKSTTEPIGKAYDYKLNEYVEYFEGNEYFIVCI